MHLTKKVMFGIDALPKIATIPFELKFAFWRAFSRGRVELLAFSFFYTHFAPLGQ
jgi:hypothetical protein